ncbi:MAG: DUF5995 family protein, partial [Bacteroidota bacterium]
LDAWKLYRKGKRPTGSWAIAFRTAEKNRKSVLQHLFLGINAHINLDLGIAAAQTAQAFGQPLAALEDDFLAINDLLLGMLRDVQSRLNHISPMLGLLDRMAGSIDEQFASFSLKKARKNAWRVAQKCESLKDGPDLDRIIRQEDIRTIATAKLILMPQLRSRAFLRLIGLAEKKDISQILTILND